MIDVWIPCVPPTTTHQAKKIVRMGGFSKLADKPELVTARSELAALFAPKAPPTPVLGPVRLSIEFTWPWRKSETKRRLALGRAPMTSAPDCSNAAKTLEDVLVLLRYIENDANVCELYVKKFWGDNPGIRVLICSIEGDGTR